MTDQWQSIDRNKLADEIEQRGIKFADLPPGVFEMLSGDEIKLITTALRSQPPTP
jgi:hypothetical protein